MRTADTLERTMDTRLGRGTYTDAPLYAEVRKRILGALQAGEWPHGGRLPTEQQLAVRYAVSVGTIRKAVDALVAERILLRQPGRGTFVANQTDESAFAKYLQFFDRSGRRVIPQARLLEFRQGKASKDVAAHLAIAAGSPMLQIDNLRIWDGKACMVDRIYLPRSVVPNMTREQFIARGGSIYGFYQDQSALTVLRVEESLTAVAGSGPIVKHLGLPEGSPLLLVQRTAFSFEDQPVEFRHRYVDTTDLTYRNIIGLQTQD